MHDGARLHHEVLAGRVLDELDVGAALLEYDRPHKVLARTKHCIFQAEAPYEKTGFIPNVVFPTGILQRDDEIWMYYGAADTSICLAKAPVSEVLSALYES